MIAEWKHYSFILAMQNTTMIFPVPASITSLLPNGIALILYMYLSVSVYKEIHMAVMVGKALVYFFGFAAFQLQHIICQEGKHSPILLLFLRLATFIIYYYKRYFI